MEHPQYQHGSFHGPDSLQIEKYPLLNEISQPDQKARPRQKQKAHSVFAAISSILLLLGALHWLLVNHNPWSRFLVVDSLGQLDFETIIPSEKLQWHPCRERFLCARLTVPMDYNRPLNASKDNPKVHIALLMAPGMHTNPNEYSISPLLLNPGGPGGAGTWFAMFFGKPLQAILGADQDVIGFDPRGVGSTTPRADCYSDPWGSSDPDAQYNFGYVDYLNGFYKRISWLLPGTQVGLVNSTSSALTQLEIRARTLGKLCAQKDSLHGNNSIFRHLQTPNVARDILSIIDAWDEWRDSLDSRSKLSSVSTDSPVDSESKYPLDTKGKLVFWGFSYGTLLGATFSAMFPDRVGRVVLDGVIDADFYVEPIWSKSIIDTDPIIDSFPKYCHKGKENCTLYRPGDSYEDIKTRFIDAQANLRAHPLSFIGPTSHYPYVFTIDILKQILFSALYTPVTSFNLIGLLVNAIIQEDFQTLEFLFPLVPKEVFCNTQPEYAYPDDTQLGVVCGDKRYPLNETVADLEKRFEDMSTYSSFSDVWLSLMMNCNGWSIPIIDPPMQWGRHPAAHPKDKPINTSFPVLFVSNTYDPVTPLKAGLKMARLFEDSGLIEQKSMGHCSISSVSTCTMRKVKAYFVDGKVPAHPIKGKSLRDGKWERCEADEWPFHPYEKGGWMDRGDVQINEEDTMAGAVKDMQSIITENGFFQHNDGYGGPKLNRVNTAKCGARRSGGH